MGTAKHPVVWFEVMGVNEGNLGAFYSELFAWNIDSKKMPGYGLVDTGSKEGIPGGIGKAQNGGGPSVTFYVQTKDLQKSLDEAEKLGGKTVMPPTDMPEVSLAMFSDPEGNVVGLVKG